MSGLDGFMYASFVNSSLNFTICGGNATLVRESVGVIGDQWGNLTNTTNLTNALDGVSSIMSSAYPLTFSCYYGGAEARDTFVGYGTTLTNPKQLAFNVFASMGFIYDTVYYLIGWYLIDRVDLQTDEDVAAYWYRIGAYGGILIHALLVN